MVVTADLGATLCRISFELGRQVAILLDRRGRVEYVIVGDSDQIVIPELARARGGAGRLKGLRLIHTHLRDEPLSKDDLNDLAMLRLDLVMAIGVGKDGSPANGHVAHLNPDRGGQTPWMLLDPVPFTRFTFDVRRFVEELEAQMGRVDARRAQSGDLGALLVHVSPVPPAVAERRLEELAELARTERIVALDRVSIRAAANPKTLAGSGRIKDLILRAMTVNADMILFDQELTGAQAKAIESMADMPLLDRTQLILRIFGRRAHSNDGKLRVELAQLKYLLPRVGAKDDALSRIRGGIGMRGPGETAMELSRRRLTEKILVIERKLARLTAGRDQRRAVRKRSGVPQVAIVGYTNAGKSTLLNALTKSTALVEDKLFATLDPTTRRIRFPRERELIFSDTVGFIRELPEHLLDAFRSTLEELADADLLLHVVDLSSPDYEEELATVVEILAQLGLDKTPRRLVFNKIDKVDAVVALNEATRWEAATVSASERMGLSTLTDIILDDLARAGKGTGEAVGETEADDKGE
ncbi:MAG: GTPase HflX [Nitrospinae bacterium]|nr:GTPase HflX [Nitrospinota bacterium]